MKQYQQKFKLCIIKKLNNLDIVLNLISMKVAFKLFCFNVTSM